MRIKTKLSTGLVTLAITVFAAGMTVAAAPKADGISIKGSFSAMNVGETRDLDSRITPKRNRVRDRNIIWKSSDSKIIKVLDKRDDDTEIKALKTGTATITVSIRNTNIKASKAITVKKESVSSSSKDEKKIDNYKKQLQVIRADIKKTNQNASYRVLREKYYGFERRIESINDKLDDLETHLEDKYRSGLLSRKKYRTLDSKLESVEDYADSVEDYLDRVFGDDLYDDDDYYDDYDD